MIRPQQNGFREALELGGLWTALPDPEDAGERLAWQRGFESRLRVAVPASWNEQLAEVGLMNYVGAMWFTREVHVPASFVGQRICLQFGSADFRATVWLNGVCVGASGSTFLPFELDVTPVAKPGTQNRLVVRVDNRLRADEPTQPVDADDYRRESRPRDETFPPVRFDFFPYGGLARPIWLTATPAAGIRGVRLHADFDTATRMGSIKATVAASSGCSGLRLRLDDHVVDAQVTNGDAAQLTMAGCAVAPWSTDAPTLHTLHVEALCEGRVIDSTVHRIGFRRIEIRGARLLLNGVPIFLRGFGKHEDSPFRGRGLDLPLLVKDFGLLDWIGANSVRTSHYAYDESFLDMADERGILVISEVGSINLDFRRVTPQTLEAHLAAASAQVARDGNHACVIAWSLANEPGYLGEREYAERSADYWRPLFAQVRRLDPTRPLTCAQVERTGHDDPAFEECDFISINRYYGWYTQPGQIERAAALLAREFDELARRHGKPILLSEFGADSVAGQHATYDQLFTEEYQESLIAACLDVVERHPHALGAHVWNFADFRTAQHFRRVVLNLKGVFTRGREPKRAAWMLRQRWRRT